jgi:hypothetical protein
VVQVAVGKWHFSEVALQGSGVAKVFAARMLLAAAIALGSLQASRSLSLLLRWGRLARWKGAPRLAFSLLLGAPRL